MIGSCITLARCMYFEQLPWPLKTSKNWKGPPTVCRKDGHQPRSKTLGSAAMEVFSMHLFSWYFARLNSIIFWHMLRRLQVQSGPWGERSIYIHQFRKDSSSRYRAKLGRPSQQDIFPFSWFRGCNFKEPQFWSIPTCNTLYLVLRGKLSASQYS